MIVEDPLKLLDKIFVKDREFIDWEIEELYEELSKIKLNESVPKEAVGSESLTDRL